MDKASKLESINKNHEKKKRDENKGILEKNSTEKDLEGKYKNTFKGKGDPELWRSGRTKNYCHVP